MKPMEKISEVENSLREIFKRQQQEHANMNAGYVSPNAQIKTEKRENYPSLSRKNVALFEQQQQQQQTEMSKLSPTFKEWNKNGEFITRDEALQSEITDLKGTINKYEIMVLNLMQKLRTERDTHKVTMKDLTKTNDSLKNDLLRMSETFKAMTDRRKEEQKDMSRYKSEMEKLIEKNQHLEEDLSKMVETYQTSDSLLNEVKKQLGDKESINEHLSTERLQLEQQVKQFQREISQINIMDPDVNTKGHHKEKISTGKLLIFLFLLICLLSFFFRKADAAVLSDECDYDSEIFF